MKSGKTWRGTKLYTNAQPLYRSITMAKCALLAENGFNRYISLDRQGNNALWRMVAATVAHDDEDKRTVGNLSPLAS